MNRPQLMGILNLAPDSFSGDGLVSTEQALQCFTALVGEGADMIDIGAESTRPGATPLSPQEEWARLAPVLDALVALPSRANVKLSLDSYHPTTVKSALNYGIDLVNDVSGFRADAMLQILSATQHEIVVMHSLSVPADPDITWEHNVDPVAEILRWKSAMLQRALASGIDSTRLIFDPGIGFGKTARQSLALVARAHELVASGGRWLVGHSRKSFLKAMASGHDAGTRDEATLLASAMLATAGVQMLRVHAVARHRAMLDALCN